MKSKRVLMPSNINRFIDTQKVLTPATAFHRPWGYYLVLADEPDHKIKRIVVNPGERLSLQKHQKRAEHWYVIAGRALVTLEGKPIELSAGKAIDIPRGATHRMENLDTSPLVFIEVQTGDYFGEDDIERMEDDYGRIP